jgi:hypothetical protein
MLTEEQKFILDLKGYLVIPEVLSHDLINRLKDQIDRLESDPDSLPIEQRSLPGGAFAELIDHPAVMDVLGFAIHRKREKVRLENTFYSIRHNGDTGIPPHGGGPTLNPNYHYHAHNGQIYTGMLRVVYELNEVVKGQGGTLFMAGSHKANFKVPQSVFADPDAARRPDSVLFEGYGCPPGSMVVFAEAICHSGNTWRNPDHPRIAIFYAYNHVNVRHHKPAFKPEVIDSLSPERQIFFHEVYHPQFDRR